MEDDAELVDVERVEPAEGDGARVVASHLVPPAPARLLRLNPDGEPRRVARRRGQRQLDHERVQSSEWTSGGAIASADGKRHSGWLDGRQAAEVDDERLAPQPGLAARAPRTPKRYAVRARPEMVASSPRGPGSRARRRPSPGRRARSACPPERRPSSHPTLIARQSAEQVRRLRASSRRRLRRLARRRRRRSVPWRQRRRAAAAAARRRRKAEVVVKRRRERRRLRRRPCSAGTRRPRWRSQPFAGRRILPPRSGKWVRSRWLYPRSHSVCPSGPKSPHQIGGRSMRIAIALSSHGLCAAAAVACGGSRQASARPARFEALRTGWPLELGSGGAGGGTSGARRGMRMRRRRPSSTLPCKPATCPKQPLTKALLAFFSCARSLRSALASSTTPGARPAFPPLFRYPTPSPAPLRAILAPRLAAGRDAGGSARVDHAALSLSVRARLGLPRTAPFVAAGGARRRRGHRRRRRRRRRRWRPSRGGSCCSTPRSARCAGWGPAACGGSLAVASAVGLAAAGGGGPLAVAAAIRRRTCGWRRLGGLDGRRPPPAGAPIAAGTLTLLRLRRTPSGAGPGRGCL